MTPNDASGNEGRGLPATVGGVSRGPEAGLAKAVQLAAEAGNGSRDDARAAAGGDAADTRGCEPPSAPRGKTALCRVEDRIAGRFAPCQRPPETDPLRPREIDPPRQREVGRLASKACRPPLSRLVSYSQERDRRGPSSRGPRRVEQGGRGAPS